MTIFGYNTDVKHADVVYHVQSEARQNDLLLQTLVYVKGQCVGKHAFSYAHKKLIDALHQGHLDLALDLRSEISDVDGSGLVLTWTNPRDAAHGSAITMR